MRALRTGTGDRVESSSAAAERAQTVLAAGASVGEVLLLAARWLSSVTTQSVPDE